MPGQAINDLIEAAYAAAVDDIPWRAFAERLQAELGVSSVSLWRGGPAEGVAEFLYTPPHHAAALASYARHYYKTDVWTAAGARLGAHAAPDGRPWVLLGSELVPEAEFRATEFYTDFCRPLGMFHAAGTVVPLGEAGQLSFGCHRPEQAPAFGEAERAIIAALIPHLRRALQLRYRLRQSELADAAAAFNAMPTAAVVVDAALRIVRANAAAETVAARTTGGVRFVRDGQATRLAAETRTDTTALAERVRQVAVHGGDGGFVRLRRTAAAASATGDLAALVSPLPARLAATDASGLGRRPGRALVMLRDPLGTVPTPPKLLIEMYGLSRHEAEVAAAAATGETAEAIAAVRGVSTNTVRSQLRQVLAKTGADNLRGLARLVTGLGS